MIVLLVGGKKGIRDNFYNYAQEKARTAPGIIFLNNVFIHDLSCVHLVVNFGEEVIANTNKVITWSGDHSETLGRIYNYIKLSL